MWSFVSYQTDEDVEWTDIKRNALEAITKFFESGDPITTGPVNQESSKFIKTSLSHFDVVQFYILYCVNYNVHFIILGHSEDDDEIVSMIKELLDTRIRYQTISQSEVFVYYNCFLGRSLTFFDNKTHSAGGWR